MTICHPSLAAISSIDWGIIVLYAIGMVAVGFYYSRKINNTEDYLLGGRQMKPLMVGLSLFASLLSTISYLSYTGEMIRYGPMFITGALAFPFVIFVVGSFMIPYFMKLRVTSAYEILEQRLGLSIRLLGSSLFTLDGLDYSCNHRQGHDTRPWFGGKLDGSYLHPDGRGHHHLHQSWRPSCRGIH